MTQNIFQRFLTNFVFIIIISVFALINNDAYCQVKGYNQKEIIVDTTRSAWWYSGQAKEQYENKNYQQAIVDFTRAILIDPEVPEFYYYRGNSFAFIKESQNALQDYKKALELNPDYLSAINNLGWEYLKRGEITSAIRYFINYLKLVPKDPKLFFGIGLNSDYLNLLNNLGWESLRNQQLPEAIRYFKNYLKLAPNDPDAYLGMALIYHKYRDIENASTYLNQAKKLEPSLYQGVLGVSALERAGCIYTPDDKEMIKKLFQAVNDKHEDLKTITQSGALKFLLGFMYIILGVIALSIFIFRIKRLEGYIFYLALLNLSFGLKFLFDNPLIRLTEIPSPQFWIYAMPLVAFIIPVAFILFIRYFIGWGWKNSILVLLIYSVLQGVIKVIAEYSEPAQDIYGTTNTIFGLLAAIVLFSHLFLPEMRKNREVQIIGAGLGFYLLAVLYDNLAQMQWLPQNLSFDEPAYLFFNICLIFVAFRRITNTEKEFLAVKQDLETAKNIQNAILPDENPKGENFEIGSAYLPMALIGGDFYDYHLSDKNRVGILIADVSGHGISAALIASMIKVAFNSQVNNAHLPSVVLQRMNMGLSDQLNNEFITAGYLGLDFTRKTLTYSSAGHPPMVLFNRNNNQIKEISVPGIPIGIFPETEFNETSMKFDNGDRLILYTDGIMDVMNPAGDLFGKKRFLELIQETKNLMPDDAVDSMMSRINAFANKDENESHEDDITVIIIDINTTDKPIALKKEHQIILENNLQEIATLANEISVLGKKWEWSEKFIHDINLALEELVSNIILYAYADESEHKIDISIVQDSKQIRILVKDDGLDFDWLNNQKKVDINAAVEEREIGGLGIHLLKKLMDEITYSRKNGFNIVSMIKNI